MSSIVGFVKRLEDFFFRYRATTLLLLLALTVGMGILASRLRERFHRPVFAFAAA